MRSGFPLAGISIYIPSEGEHLVLSLVKSPNNIVACADVGKPTTPGRPELIQISLFAECGNCKAVTRNLIYTFITLNDSTNDVILAILLSDIG